MTEGAEPRETQGDPSLFQFTGGLLERSIYVERPADRLLPEALLAGSYCHILAPRQIGKTSLCFRAARALQKDGVRCALVDVTAAGTPSTPEEWYFGLVDEIARRLKLPDPLDAWQRRPGVAPAQRFRDYVRALVEDDPTERRVVVFLDEIEMVRLSPVDVDDFLLILRSFHEERGQSPALRRLSFCLIGVTTPNDLIKNKSVTPFNVSKPIRVDDFTRPEIDALAPGLEGLDADPVALLDGVYRWTDGHPYMTMRACFELSRQRRVRRGHEAEAADAVVRALFLDRPLEDTNLNYAARRFEDAKFDREGARLADKVQLYRRVLAQKDPPAHNESAVQMELRICGMVKDVEVAPGKRVLRPRNRIYESALDMDWLRSKGDRRFVSDAVWRWLDSGKNEAALLRGVVLEKALVWAQSNVLSEDEQAFLDASQRHETHVLEAERTRITLEVAAVQTAQCEVQDELTRAREALARATTDRDAAEEARRSLEEQRTALKASVRKTKWWLYTALMGLLLAAVIAAVVVQQTRSQVSKLATEASARAADAISAQHRADDLRREIDNLKPQVAALREKEEELKKKDAELKTKQDEIAQKDEELQKRDADIVAKDEELQKKLKIVASVNAYIARNKDLDDSLKRTEKTLNECRDAKAKLERQVKQQQWATPPTPTTTQRNDPYSP
ncbi:MAG: AAA-like domain-containing protein [Polyangiaceae bacterium]